MKKLLVTLSILLFVAEGFAQPTTTFPKVDFSYAFSTPHRITVGRPTNGNRTLLDLQPGSLKMSWWYKDLTTLPLNTPSEPSLNAFKREANITPIIDGKPFSDSKWTRMEGWLPSLDNTYVSQQGTFRIEMIVGKTATIGKVEVVNTDHVEHEFRLECKMDWSINKGWIDWERFSSDCLFSGYQDRVDRILVMGIGADRWTLNPTGQATNDKMITFIWCLKPGEKKMSWIVQPYESYEADLSALRSNNWEQEMKNAKQEWQDLISRTRPINIPDKNIINAFKACFSDLFIMREPAKDGYVVGVAGTQMYRAPGTGEPIIAAIAMDQFGLHSDAAEQLRIHIDTQGLDGDWADPHGWVAMYWSIPGCKSWAAMEHYQMTGDKKYLETVYTHMLASSRFNESQRARSRILQNGERPINYGLMPRGPSDSGSAGDDDYYGVFTTHNIWSVYGDSLTLEAARILGKTNDIEELERIYRTAKNDLLYTIDKGAINEGSYRWIPAKAGSTKGSHAHILNALFPCHLFSPYHELMTGTLRLMEQNIDKGGLPLHLGYMVNGVWAALALDNLA